MADTASSRSSDNTYQLYVFCGSDEMPAASDASVMRIAPAGDSADDVLAAITASGITAADLRTRTLFMLGSVPTLRAVMTYAALSGFAGRLLDFSDLSEVFEVRPLLTQLHEAPDAGKPETDKPGSGNTDIENGEGAAAPEGSTSVIDLSVESIPGEFSPELVSKIRYAKEFTVLLTDEPAKALEAFVFVTGLRFRGGVERFPLVALQGTAPVDTDVLRREAATARRNRRTDDRGSLVPKEVASSRTSTLRTAAAADPAAVLTALGSVMNAETGFWRCPRPERHRNGDANPSARLSEEGFRCFRCDVEQVDPLRLVMDAKDLCPDDAAEWILSIG